MSVVARLTKTFWLLAFAAALGLVWAPLARALSYEEEEQIARRIHHQIAAANALVTDPAVTQYVNQVGRKILRPLGRQPFQYHFYVIRSASLNAFALPAGYIYINSELIASLENEGQLAAILAHEIAHVVSRHVAGRMESSKNLSWAALAMVLAGAIVGSLGGGGEALGPALMMGGSAASIQAMLYNSREDETEADNKGRKYLAAAGYHTRDMYGAFKIMQERTYHTSRDIPSYLNTHPGLSERLAASASKGGETASPYDARYQAIRNRVLALTGEPNRVRNTLLNRLEKDPQDAEAKYGLAILAARQQNLARAIELINESLKSSPGNAEYLADLGELHLMKRNYAEARQALAAALKINPQNRRAALYLARAYELTNNTAEAGRYYDQAVAALDDYDYDPEAFELAGRFFGQNGQLFKGHYLTGRYFENSGRLDQALFHYRETRDLNGPAQLKSQVLKRIAFLEEVRKENQKNAPGPGGRRGRRR